MTIWFAASFVVACVLAWISTKLQVLLGMPIGISSICLGLAFGFAFGGLAVLTKVRPSRRLIVAASALTFAAIASQHAWHYLEFRRQWHQARANSPHVAMFRSESPWSPAEYFGRELKDRRGAVWCVDAVLIAAPAIGVFWLMERNRRAAGVASDAKPLNPEA